MSEPNPAVDRAWCRAALPRVSRTFALNIRVLADPFRGVVETGYLLCRAADTLEDSWPGTPAEIGERFALLLAALEGRAEAAEALASRARAVAAGVPELELVAELPSVWRSWCALPDVEREILAAGVRTLAAGMCRYATRAAQRDPDLPYLDTEAELREYCWIVAGCVGVMLTRLFGAARRARDRHSEAIERSRLERAPAVGEALQLTNILLDWPVDVRRGRCYLPADWLAEHGLGPRNLVGAPRPGTDALARRLEALARAALARVPDYLETIPPRAARFRLFTVWPALWALASLEHARSDPEFPWGARRPRLPRARLAREAWRGLAGHRGAALARLRKAAAEL
ncbi:MAG TPA: squalene/phytoene synthase family protein [Terriglobales bacterium]|nr:squalene/phytoene synthase family protein [Terriglobales bacterium]